MYKAEHGPKVLPHGTLSDLKILGLMPLMSEISWLLLPGACSSLENADVLVSAFLFIVKNYNTKAGFLLTLCFHFDMALLLPFM